MVGCASLKVMIHRYQMVIVIPLFEFLTMVNYANVLVNLEPLCTYRAMP